MRRDNPYRGRDACRWPSRRRRRRERAGAAAASLGAVLVLSAACAFDSSAFSGGATVEPVLERDAGPGGDAGVADAASGDDAGPGADAANSVGTLRIEALIDGRSLLVLRRGTARWQHLRAAAPGRDLGRDAPTVINGVPWLPAWPDVPDAQNTDCNCSSDAFDGVRPAIPAQVRNVELALIEARSPVVVAEQPAPDNDFAVVLDFDDVQSSSARYVVELRFRRGP